MFALNSLATQVTVGVAAFLFSAGTLLFAAAPFGLA